MEDQDHCIACGKLLENETIQILEGKVDEGDFLPKKEFGRLHRACFLEAVPTPRNALELLREEAANAASA